MTDFLFDVPPQDSPRLAWMKRHGVVTWMVQGCDVDPWCASTEEQVKKCDTEGLGTGDTEDDALADFARRRNLRLWNEEQLSTNTNL